MPSSVVCDFRDQPRKRFSRTAGGKQHAAIQKNPHAFPAFLQKFSASFSSSSIQLRKVSSGMSRTGRASAGCKKTPPSLSSTSIIGFSTASSPILRRISGGKVIVPRLDIGILIMQQCCNTVMRPSSRKLSIPNSYCSWRSYRYKNPSLAKYPIRPRFRGVADCAFPSTRASRVR